MISLFFKKVKHIHKQIQNSKLFAKTALSMYLIKYKKNNIFLQTFDSKKYLFLLKHLKEEPT